MIPKIIHSVWVGPRSIPEQHQRWMAGWQLLHPEFKFLHWDNTNIDTSAEALRIALHCQKWAGASDIIRLQVLRRFGGIYLDTDIEGVRPFNSLLAERCFVGFTSSGPVTHCINNAVIGAVPEHPFIVEALKRTLEIDQWRSLGPSSGPDTLRDILSRTCTLTPSNDGMRVDDVYVAPSRFFYPYYWTERYSPACVGSDTICIHHWTISWDRTAAYKRRIQALSDKLPFLSGPVRLLRSVWSYCRPLLANVRLRLNQISYRHYRM
jgi:mannosyltransferase OCH1-like enzyme